MRVKSNVSMVLYRSDDEGSESEGPQKSDHCLLTNEIYTEPSKHCF